MAHTHSHDQTTYYTEQLCTIGSDEPVRTRQRASGAALSSWLDASRWRLDQPGPVFRALGQELLHRHVHEG